MSTLSENKVLEGLLQSVLSRGYLVTDDLLAALPEVEDNMKQLEEIFVQLIDQGIEVYADVEEAEEEKRLNSVRTEKVYNLEDLALPETRAQIGRLSPSFIILEKLLSGRINLDKLHWREFEELIADLLEKDGFVVELGPGRDDGGVDLIAYQDLGGVGLIKSVWQAKKKQIRNKVGISVVRELADARNEHKASKGIIVTSTYLTRGALERVQRDRYILGKIDRDDLMIWADRILRERK